MGYMVLDDVKQVNILKGCTKLLNTKMCFKISITTFSGFYNLIIKY